MVKIEFNAIENYFEATHDAEKKFEENELAMLCINYGRDSQKKITEIKNKAEVARTRFYTLRNTLIAFGLSDEYYTWKNNRCHFDVRTRQRLMEGE